MKIQIKDRFWFRSKTLSGNLSKTIVELSIHDVVIIQTRMLLPKDEKIHPEWRVLRMFKDSQYVAHIYMLKEASLLQIARGLIRTKTPR